MILICGDLVPTKSNESLFASEKLDTLIGEGLQDLLNQACYRIANLEVPIVDSLTPIPKHGPNLCTIRDTLSGISRMHIDLLSMANNHIYDHGEKGLKTTLDAVSAAGIAHVGAGMDIEQANSPTFFEVNGKRVGIFSCAEHEFSIADEHQPGAAPFDPLETPDWIATIKKTCDMLVVLYHGGKEYYRYPSPMLQKTCRKLVEKGADLVVCQHSHCIGCYERYRGASIVYGQGNFIFDDDDNEFYKTGLIIGLDEQANVNFYPIMKYGCCVRLAVDKEKQEILNAFEKRSLEIKQPGFIEQQYRQFAEKMLISYARGLKDMKRPFMYRMINKVCHGALDQMRAERYLHARCLQVMNMVDCEAHRELLLHGLKEWAKAKKGTEKPIDTK